MNSQQFVDTIKKVVRDGAINDVLSVTEHPPGRKVSQQLKARAEWYRSLPEQQKEFVRSIVSDAVDSALFGFFCVIDGVRAVEDDTDKGRFELRYLKGESVVHLNSQDGIMLHDLYNAQHT
jgi:hypothetical protein